MKKIKDLEELRAYLGQAVESGLKKLNKKWICRTSRKGVFIELTGWKALRSVIVGDPEAGIRLCARAEKTEAEKEIVLLRKTAVLKLGLTPKEWDRVVEKCSLWLEKRDLFPKQTRYSDKKQGLFQ